MYAEVLEHDINLANAGILGENTILFELQNSHMPLFVLHDLQPNFMMIEIVFSDSACGSLKAQLFGQIRALCPVIKQ